MRVVDRINWLNIIQVNTTGYNVISNIETLLLSQATSVTSFIANINTKVKLAFATDVKKGLEILQDLKGIYSEQMQYMAQGLSRTMSEGADLISAVQIIIIGSKRPYPQELEELDYTKTRSLLVSVHCYSYLVITYKRCWRQNKLSAYYVAFSVVKFRPIHR